jgi:type II secretory pathway pseudopilin PulG
VKDQSAIIESVIMSRGIIQFQHKPLPGKELGAIVVARGATWLDLVAVLGIVGLLVAITLPMLANAKFQAYRSRCADNLREIGAAFSRYAMDNHGALPSTRSSADAPPDVSSAGAHSPDPFANPELQNNIPSAVFLLVRTGLLDSATLVCQGSSNKPDRFEGTSPAKRSNFTDVPLNLSYAMQNPYVSKEGFSWKIKDLKPGYALMADRGPANPKLGNSINHDRQGQNVLYANLGVEFVTTRNAGIDQDDIYVNKSGSTLFPPVDLTDNMLLPCE